jgi:hypothetical protein
MQTIETGRNLKCDSIDEKAGQMLGGSFLQSGQVASTKIL